MKKLLLAFIMSVICFSRILLGGWDLLPLPYAHFYPCENPPCGNRESGIYSLQFPTGEKKWFLEPFCTSPKGDDAYRMTSKRFMSNHTDNISGLSFKGLLYKSQLGSRANEFAIFFHEDACYNGGAEYGWVFPENSLHAYFYLCADCNLGAKQRWCTWPDMGEGVCMAAGDCSAVRALLEKPATYRYWNIKVTKDGDFLIELLDPVTWDYSSCLIKKPDWFPNLYRVQGYVTINAQRGHNVRIQPPATLHVDEVKIWRE